MATATKKKKPHKQKPTIKQRRAIAVMLENGGNASKAMREAGYSDAMAKNPHKLTESLGFKELAAKALPDDLLLRIHKQGLQATKTDSLIIGYEPQGKGKKSVPIVEIREGADFAVRHKYLDTAYKVLGKIKESNVVIPVQVNVNEDREAFA